MAKGAAFEEKSLEYLKKLFEQLGFAVTEARRQGAGTQNGFDIRIAFIDDSGKERKFYFECKDYTTGISWNDIAIKVHELNASSHKADGYIALSPHVNFSNINVNVLDKLVVTTRTPIKCWTPETYIREYISVDNLIYEAVYGTSATATETDKTAILQKIRAVIVDMLRRKDELAKQGPEPSLPKELTLKIPRIHPDDIIGREAELQQLHELLFDSGRVVVVNGLGGIGKTTLAQGYIGKYYNEYRHIAWVTHLTDDMVTDIINAEGLAEKLSVDKQGKQRLQVCNEILHRLKDIPDSPNLLILDNANEKLVALKNVLPAQPRWHVLVTSRERVDGFYLKALDFLSPEQAIALFQKHCSFIKDEVLVAELVKNIDFHTLTIEILAKTAQRRKLNIEVLKTSIQDDLSSNVYVEHKGEKIDRVRSYLSSIFNLSGLNEEEAWMMKQFACLPTEFHTYELLMELISPDEEKKEAFAETLNRLVEQGWLLHNEETDAYKMHVIVKEVVMKELSPSLQDVEQLMDNILEKLNSNFNLDNPVIRFPWVPYGEALLNAFRDSTATKFAELQSSLGVVLQDLSDFNRARMLLEKAIPTFEHNLGADHPTTATNYARLASILKDLGDYRGARSLLIKAMHSDERHYGPQHPITARRYSSLAIVLKDLGDYNSAMELSQKAMHSFERNLGPEHVATARIYADLGWLFNLIGNSNEARRWLEKSLPLLERHLGVDHPYVGAVYSNLGLVFQSLRKYDEARLLLEKAVHLFERNFGPNHIDTARIYSNLAMLLMLQGEKDHARTLLEKAIHTGEHYLSPIHPFNGTNYGNMAYVLKELGDYPGACGYFKKALASIEQEFPPNHPGLAQRYYILAGHLEEMGDYSWALELAAKSLAIVKEILPDGHSNIKLIQDVYESIKAKMEIKV
jgi:tetratricopeptide (TPR) repeat protein